MSMRNLKRFSIILATVASLLFLPLYVASLTQEDKPIRPVTPQQKEHSTLYKNLGSRKLSGPNIGGTHIYDLVPPTSWNRRHIHPTEFLGRIACEADAVIIGTLMDGAAMLTENDSFIFTDYAVQIEEILKDNPSARLVTSGSVTVTRPGGTLEIEGRKVQASLDGFNPFNVGRRYLLYLRFMPLTGAYQAFGDRSFELRGKRYIKLTRQHVWTNHIYKVEDASSFLAIVRSTTTGSCVNASTNLRKTASNGLGKESTR